MTTAKETVSHHCLGALHFTLTDVLGKGSKRSKTQYKQGSDAPSNAQSEASLKLAKTAINGRMKNRQKLREIVRQDKPNRGRHFRNLLGLATSTIEEQQEAEEKHSMDRGNAAAFSLTRWVMLSVAGGSGPNPGGLRTGPVPGDAPLQRLLKRRCHGMRRRDETCQGSCHSLCRFRSKRTRSRATFVGLLVAGFRVVFLGNRLEELVMGTAALFQRLQLSTQHTNVAWRIDPQSNRVPLNPQHRHGDVVAQVNFFVQFATQNQHGNLLLP